VRCLVNRCEIKDNGGCYCACLLHDYIKNLENVIAGIKLNKGCLYIPDEERRKEWFESLSPERQAEEIKFKKEEAPLLLKEAYESFEKYLDNRI
jgi:hypothetical protein